MATSRDVTQLRETLLRRMESVSPLEDEPDFFTKPSTLTRYLNAYNLSVDEAEKMLKATVEWRRERQPLSLDCLRCHQRPGMHSVRQVGHDVSGHPVIYCSFSQPAVPSDTAEATIDHLVYVLENATRTMPPAITSWTFIVDCSGISLAAFNPKIGYGIAHVMSRHYPDRLAQAICVNHSSIFQGVWQAISVFLHPETLRKIHFVRSKTKMADLFRQNFSEEQVTWLMDEISLNREHPLAASQKRFWEKPRDSVTSHDPRGCPPYVRDYLETRGRYGGASGDRSGHKPHPSILDDMTDASETRSEEEDELDLSME